MPKIPDVLIPGPDCPICDGALIADGGWSCESCSVFWDFNGMNGTAQDCDRCCSQRCCIEHDVHAMPHVGCILR